MIPTLNSFLDSAIYCVKTAGAKAQALQATLGPAQAKGEKDLVTEADFECDKLIRHYLQTTYPTHDLVTEEHEALRQGGNYCWVVDPIDGTVNYAHGLPLWGVSVALTEKGQVLCAAIYLPMLNELYTAILGGGAFLNGKPLRVSTKTNLGSALVSHGDFNVGINTSDRIRLNSETLQSIAVSLSEVARLKCMGSAVVEGAFVAAGRLDAFWMNIYYPWDVAATSLLIQEAGGTITDLKGGKFQLEKKTVLFSNGHLHQTLLDLIGFSSIQMR